MNTNMALSLILITGVLNAAGAIEKAEVKTKENYLFSSFRKR